MNFSGDTLELTAPLTVCIDFSSANSYLAIAPTLALKEQLDIEIDWLSVASIKKFHEHDDETLPIDISKQHTTTRSRYLRMDERRYAQKQGITLNQPKSSIDSSAAAAGLLWVKQQATSKQTAYVVAVLGALWVDGSDISGNDVLSKIVRDIGLDVDSFIAYLETVGPANQKIDQTRIEAANVTDTPTYFADNDMYIGRQHLSYIRWRLLGSVGDTPF